MIKFSKILLYLSATLILAWVLPWFYNFLEPAAPRRPFVMYSAVVGDFAILESSADGTVRKDLAGNTYTDKQFDSILPLFYYRQLMADGKFPDTLNGEPVSARVAQNENFMFRSSPRSVNNTPVPLYPLLESMSTRVDLEMPDDVFRLDRRGITFIDCTTNQVKKEKSRTFTDAMIGKGFQFPAVLIDGDPNTRKEYDEGYLVTDANGKLFHLKQTVGRPYVRYIELPADLEISHVLLTEFRSRKHLAFMTDVDGKFYMLETESYALKPLDIPPVDLRRDNFVVQGNAFDWTVTVTYADGSTSWYAIDARDYSRVAELTYPKPEPDNAKKIGGYLFPFQLKFTSTQNTWAYPDFYRFSIAALPLAVVLALIYGWLHRRRGVRETIPGVVYILLLGLYAFIPLLIFGKR